MSGCNNVEIRNGTVRDFYTGIYEDDSSGHDHRIIDVRALSNTQCGVHLLGNSHLVKDCTATDNGDSAAANPVYGISTGYAGTVTGNTVRNNGHSAGDNVRGISGSTGCTIVGNTAYENGNTASGTVYGICLSGSSLVDQNTASGNFGTNMNTPPSCTFGTNHAP